MANFLFLYTDVDEPKENVAPTQLKVKSIPLDTKGRKRRQSVSALDDDVDSHSKSVRSSKYDGPSTAIGESVLINLSESPISQQNSNSFVPNPVSTNLRNIMNDLNGLDFTANAMNTEKKRPVPGLFPLKPIIAKGDVVKMILRRTEPNELKTDTQMLDDMGSLHYSDSE